MTEETEILIENKFNENLRERNITRAIVEAVPDGYTDCKIGDLVWINHFIMMDHSNNIEEHGIKHGGKLLFRCPISEVFAKWENESIVPLADFHFCEIFYEERENIGSFELPEYLKKKRIRDRVRVLIPNGTKNRYGLKPGDVVHILKSSDYLINVKGTDYARVRESEINAILT